jgi:L-cysteine:1D-myo-inositol 2-amino-2-deoxy-alpha-D-glucopyranoside ligase
MDLRIHNTMTGRKENFRARDGKVGIYVCGITPYDTTHLGHAFTYVFFDVVVRYFRSQEFNVKYVQNLTDVDDDILKKAAELGKGWREVVKENTKRFLEDMRWLNNIPPDVYPRATDHMNDIVRIAKGLLAKGYGYEKGGNVYFSLNSNQGYGKLSKLTKKEMLPIANQRGNNPEDPNKRDPLDFVLWQAKKPGEPSWKSPWGEGRPGWHIECTAMSTKYLGEIIDIHGGGGDLVFPHHESSIAQSECYTGKPFVRYWMHTGMVRYNGEKMSKSLGNLVFIRDVQNVLSSNEVRLHLLTHHYRSQWEFTGWEVEKVKAMSGLFKAAWQAKSNIGESFDYSGHEKAFFEAMDDDFDTPRAIEEILKLAEAIKQSRNCDLSGAKAFLNRAFNILGLVMEYE